MSSTIVNFSLIYFAISMYSSTHAVAVEAEVSGSDSALIERLIVTASRKDVRDTDLAMAVDSISQVELAVDSAQHVGESLNSIAGVYINQLSGGQGHKTAIRMPINTSGYYLFLQDNIPLQSPAFFNHNALWWSSFNANVSRMEVIKGAGTALYGSGAVAATVNILSANVADSPESSVGIMLGQDNYQKLQAAYSTPLQDSQGVRVSVAKVKSDGWRDHIGLDKSELTLRHEYDLSGEERLVTSVNISDLSQEMASRLNDEQFNSQRTHSGLSDDVLAIHPQRKTQYARISTQWDKTLNDAYYSVIPYLRYRTNDYTATWNANMPKVESKVRTLGLLALANFSHSVKSESTIGFDLEFTEGKQLSFQSFDVTTTGWGADTFLAGEVFYDDTTRYSALSPYYQYQRYFAEHWSFTLGARYDYAQYDFDNHIDVVGDIGHGKISLADQNDSFKHLSPKASLIYSILDNASVYWRYANSFRLPTASSLYHLTTKDSGEATAVAPEVSDTFEMGVKGNFNTFTFDSAIFYMDVDDGIVHAYNQHGQRYLTNASRVIHKGFEISVDWLLSNSVDISLAYSKSRHLFDQHDEFSGNEMKLAPDYLANVRLRYRPEAIAGLTMMLETQSVGEYWMDDANSVDPDTGRDRIYSGFTVFNLKAYYSWSDALSFNARIHNATDKVYAHEAEYRYGQNSWAPGTPRTVYIGLNVKW